MTTKTGLPPKSAEVVTAKIANLQLDADLPNDVSTTEQLTDLPAECLSQHDPTKPLRHVDEKDNVYHYFLKPMLSSVPLILAVETIERFSFYGVYYTQTFYLTGVYNEDWNAGFDSVTAASFVSVATAVAYSTPFIGAVLADSVLGDYKTIVFGTTCLYLPGLILVALTTVPGLLGEEFNTTALSFAVLLLWPTGTGPCRSLFSYNLYRPISSSLIHPVHSPPLQIQVLSSLWSTSLAHDSSIRSCSPDLFPVTMFNFTAASMSAAWSESPCCPLSHKRT